MIFPVKFPVSREIAWRPVRIPLRRQPALKLGIAKVSKTKSPRVAARAGLAFAGHKGGVKVVLRERRIRTLHRVRFG